MNPETAPPPSQRRAQNPVWVALPVVLTTLPHLGTYLQADHRVWLYAIPADTGGSFVATLVRSTRMLGPYLRDWNFRPIGRYLMDLEIWFIWEIASATGVPPHLVHGLIRTLLIGVLAFTITRFVRVYLPPRSPAARWVPLIAAAVFVVTRGSHPMLHFPSLNLTVAILTLSALIWVVRQNPPHRALSCLFGFVVGFIYEMLWLTPIVLVTAVSVWGWVNGFTFRQFIKTVPVRKTIGYTVGVAAAVLVARTVLYVSCARTGICEYPYNKVDVLIVSPSTIFSRVLTGNPVVGWVTSTFDPAVIITNSFLTFLLGGLVFWAARTLRDLPVGFGFPERSSIKAGVSLLSVGAVLTLVPAAAVSAHWALYECGFDCVGQAWKDTLLTQIGWTVIITAGVHFLLTRNFVASRIVVLLTIAALTASAGITLLQNESAAFHFRTTGDIPYETISQASVSVGGSPARVRARCELVSNWRQDASTVHDLQVLVQQIYNQPFCPELEFPDHGFRDIADTKYAAHQIALSDLSPHSNWCHWPLPRFACPTQIVYGGDIRHTITRVSNSGHLTEQQTQQAWELTRPGNTIITRTRLAEILLSLGGVDITQAPPPRYLFGDIVDRRTARIAEAAYRSGLVEPCATNPFRFCGDRYASKEEMVYGITALVERGFGTDS